MESVEDYVVFSGDLKLTYSLPSNLTLTSPPNIELVTSSPERIIHSVQIVTSSTSGELTYPCGLIDTPGIYHFRLADPSSSSHPVIARSADVIVTWPRMILQVPDEHETLSGPISVRVTLSDDITCKSTNNNMTYTIDLEVSTADHDTSFEGAQLRHRSSLDDLRQAASANIDLECSICDVAGLYRVVLASTTTDAPPIAVSNTIDVTWSQQYAVSTYKNSIFTGDDATGFNIAYGQPLCPGSQDKIRLFVQLPQPGGISLKYVSEQRARRGAWEVTFPFSDFDVNAYGYCFIYQSFAENAKTVNQGDVCVPTRDAPGEKNTSLLSNFPTSCHCVLSSEMTSANYVCGTSTLNFVTKRSHCEMS